MEVCVGGWGMAYRGAFVVLLLHHDELVQLQLHQLLLVGD